MEQLDDNGLLRKYVEQVSEEAFATLIERHINKVYSVALRHVGSPHQAEEVTQVFLSFWRSGQSDARCQWATDVGDLQPADGETGARVRCRHLPRENQQCQHGDNGLRQAMEEANRSTTVSTETHENIVVNEPLVKSDFVHPIPAGLKLETAN
jgi:hypothetical protein